MKYKNNKKKKYKKVCIYCNSENTKKRGFRKTNRGNLQRYFCHSCKRSFIEDDGFLKMRNTPHKITLCLDLFYKGVSTRKIQEHLQAFYPHNSNNATIYRWIVKYSNLIHNYTNTLKVNCGSEIQVDEMEYHRRKHHRKKGIAKNWFVDVIDTKTRFMVNSNFINGRTTKELKEVLKETKLKTEDQISIVTTDGLNAYPRVLNKTFGLNKLKWKTKIKHNIVISSEKGFNHKVERLHNSVRQLTQNFRGFHGSIYSARSIMRGYSIYYNFIRRHQTLNKTPSELAIPELELNGNKWLQLISLAKGFKE